MFEFLDFVLLPSDEVLHLVWVALDLYRLAFESLSVGDFNVSWYLFEFFEIQRNAAIAYASIGVIGFLLLDHLVS